METKISMEVRDDREMVVVKFTGNIDRQAEPLVKDLVARVERRKVVFDFSDVGRINSMGIALLLRCFKTLRDENNCTVKLRGMSQMNRMLFKMTGILLLATPEE